jgi:putative hemolysin
MDTTFLIIALVLFTGFSALMSASEIALFSLSSMTVKSYQRSQDPREQLIASLIGHPRRLFVTLFAMNIAANILIQNAASNLFGEAASWWLKVGFPVFLVIMFGDLLPKYIGLQNNTVLAYRLAPFVQTMSRLVNPLQKTVLMVVAPISRIMFSFLKKDEPISADEMQHVLNTSLDHGILHLDEVKLVSGYLELQDRQVKELMWPREDILFYDIHKPLTKLTHLFVDMECTRIPVCDDNIENVKGIITATKYFLYRDLIKTPEQLLQFLDKPYFVPETTPVRKLLRQFIERNEAVALAVDEYGSVVGLIGHEDLTELVIGEISDQRDEEVLYTRAGNNIIIASGKLELVEFERVFHQALESSHMTTLGGWLMEQLGDIPKSGTKFQTEHFLFQVLAADPNRIRRVYVRRLQSPQAIKKKHKDS